MCVDAVNTTENLSRFGYVSMRAVPLGEIAEHQPTLPDPHTDCCLTTITEDLLRVKQAERLDSDDRRIRNCVRKTVGEAPRHAGGAAGTRHGHLRTRWLCAQHVADVIR